MKQLESSSHVGVQPNIEDAEILPARGLSPYWLRVAVPLAAFAFLAATGWVINHFYIQPKGDEAVVERAQKDWIVSLPESVRPVAERRRNMLSEEDRLWSVVENLKIRSEKSQDAQASSDYYAVLRHAIRVGIPEARLLLGIALRDGVFGPRDSAGALQLFDEIERETSGGLRAGGAIAMYVDARMWLEGLGRQPDRIKARELASRAAPNLRGWRLEEVANDVVFARGFFEGSHDNELGVRLAGTLIYQGHSAGPEIGSFTCGDPSDGRFSSCNQSWYERAAKSGMESAFPGYAKTIVANSGSLLDADKWFGWGSLFSGPEERFQQAFVQAIVSTTDAEILKAMSAMWKQTQSDLPKGNHFSLSGDGGYGLKPFYDRAKAMPSKEVDNFLIALSTHGILTERLKDTVFVPWLFFGQPELIDRAQSSKIQDAARIAADAIRAGKPLDTIDLKRAVALRFFPLSERTSERGKLAGEKTKKYSGPKSATECEEELGTRAHDRQLVADCIYASLTAPSPKNTVSRSNATSEAKPVDREQQASTGYIKGEPKGAMGGLSTFTVDNRQGDSDAVARIYLNGGKPAVRHMYIKRGETFKAQSIQAGTYVFRYRYIGREDTYEADRPFELTQTESDGGTRFSNVTVTLFKVKDGNMQTKKVDASKF